jgi:hypothetical protein
MNGLPGLDGGLTGQARRIITVALSVITIAINGLLLPPRARRR